MMTLTQVWDKYLRWGHTGLKEAKLSRIQGYTAPVYFMWGMRLSDISSPPDT